MPKEITHWFIARRVAEELDGALAKAVRAHPSALLLGSVFHDIGYYGQGKAAHLVGVADRLHGSRGEDTHEILRAIAARADPLARPWLASFLVGLLTHIVADSRLHPLVYYFTGNYYDRDEARRGAAAEAHRRLETVIDLRVAGGLAEVSDQSLRRIVDSLQPPPGELFDEVATCLEPTGSGKLAASLMIALQFHARVQKVIRRPLLLRFLQPLLPLLPRSLNQNLALAYFPRLQRLMPLLDGELSYRNPMTGAPLSDRLEDALDEIVRTSVERCRDFPGELAIDDVGPSLEVGVSSAPAIDATFFHPLVLADDYRRVMKLETLAPETDHET